jgi:hypothetical protein
VDDTRTLGQRISDAEQMAREGQLTFIELPAKALDLTGKRSGRLTAIGPVKNSNNGVYWLCRCECGGTTNISAYIFRKGLVETCGCKRKIGNITHIYDDVLLDGVLSYFSADAETGRVFKIADGSKKEVGYKPKEKKLYCKIRFRDRLYPRSRIVFALVHKRWPVDLLDHINGDRHDDGISNLRECTRNENSYNLHSRSGKSGNLPRGVGAIRGGRYSARVTHKGETFFLGYYSSAKEASDVCDKKRKELFGAFA